MAAQKQQSIDLIDSVAAFHPQCRDFTRRKRHMPAVWSPTSPRVVTYLAPHKFVEWLRDSFVAEQSGRLALMADALTSEAHTLSASLAASYTHRFARSTFQRFSYATFQLRKFSVAVWRGSEGIGVFLFCHVETPGNQWTGAQFGGASLPHARTRKRWKHAHVFKGFSSKKQWTGAHSQKLVWEFSTGPHRKCHEVGDRRALWKYRML